MLQRTRAAALAFGLTALCAATLTTSAFAQNKADASLDRVKAAVQKTLGADAPIKSVARTPIPGLYEVSIGGEILYADEKAQYVILGGNLVDTKTRQNLTEARQSELNKVDFAKLPFDRAFKYVKGNGSRKIAVDWHAIQFTPDRALLSLVRDQVRVAPEYKEGEPVVVLGSPSPSAPQEPHAAEKAKPGATAPAK